MKAFLPILLLMLLGLLGHAEPAAPTVKIDPELKPNDTVQMEVFGQDDLTTLTRILKSGEVVFPLIGTVKIGGLTVSEAIEEVRSLYAEKYLVDPKVTLTVNEYASEFVSVVGAVNAAGQFPIPSNGKIDLSSAIAAAGGLNETADRNRIILTQAEGNSETFSMDRVLTGKPIPLKPGDRITVHQSRFLNKTVTILGQVRKPGPVQVPLDGRLDIVAAIAQAGGFTELANPKKVSINRAGRVTLLNLREMTEKGNRGYFLQPEDIVTVAERFF